MAFSRERDDAAEVMSAELRLLDPAVRASAAEVSTLLHDEFFEYGVSGAVWDRTQIIAALSADPTIDGKPSDVGLARLGPDAMLLTYRLEGRDRASLRSSVWVRVADQWRLRFHQGTPSDVRLNRSL